MEQPFHLEKNLENLSADMDVLKQIKHEVERQGGRKMKSWLQSVEAKEREFDEIQHELEQLKTPGFHPNKYNARLRLNKRVIENLRAVESLKNLENTEGGKQSDDSDVESRISELERGKKPQRYTYDQLENIISDEILGEGGFGDVYKGKIGKVLVAVKVLRGRADELMEKQFMNEIRPMFIASHKNLIRLYGYCFDPRKKALVYEYMVNKSLDRVLYNKQDKIQWDTLYKIAIGTAMALSNLHENYEEPIIHYDIKAANVLLDANFSPKVTDFGLCKIYGKDVSHVMQTSIGGTANYAAPEVRLGAKAITFKCDIYSFGLMLFEIIRRKRVNKDYPPKAWQSLIDGRLDKMILDCGIQKKNLEEAQRLAIVGLWCTQFVPKMRPKMSDVVKFLEGVMQFSWSPPNPDPYAGESRASETPPQHMSSAKSDSYEERADDVDSEEEDSWTDTKYASSSNLNITAKTERNIVEEEDSWTDKKYASSSNFKLPVQPKRNAVKVDFAKTPAETIQDELKERFKKASPSSSTRTTLQNEQSEQKEERVMDERKIPKFPNVQGQTNLKPNTRESGIPPTSAEAIPSIQDELKKRFGKVSASRG